jgi:hypothetical protein
MATPGVVVRVFVLPHAAHPGVEGRPNTAFVFALVFDQPLIRVGRVVRNDIVVPKDNVSRFQCSLSITNEGVLVTDSGSTCGTYVCGATITRPTPLGSADLVSFGDTVLEANILPLAVPEAAFDARHLLERAAAGDAEASTQIAASGLAPGLTHLGRLARLLAARPGSLTWNNLSATLERWPDPATREAAFEWARAVLRRTWPDKDHLFLVEWTDPPRDGGFGEKAREPLWTQLRG